MPTQQSEVQSLDSVKNLVENIEEVTLKQLQNGPRFSSGSFDKTIVVYTDVAQNYVAKAFARTQKALNEIFKNSARVEQVRIKNKDNTFTIRPAGEVKNEIRENIKNLQVFIDAKMEEAELLTKDCTNADSVRFNGIKSIRLAITSPEAHLYTFFVEALDYIVKQYEIAWLNMLITDDEKFKLINSVRAKVSQSSFKLAEISVAFSKERAFQKRKRAEAEKSRTQRKEKNRKARVPSSKKKAITNDDTNQTPEMQPKTDKKDS
jgi:hypothetical protein